MTEARLSLCSLGHAAVLAELHGGCFEKPWRVEDFSNLLGAPGVAALMVMADPAVDEPCGFILWRIAADEAEIITLCVLSAQRGKKMGRALTKGAMQRAGAVAKTMYLEVAEDNQFARRLYEGLGFAETGRRRNYYKTGASRADAIVYGRSIE
ncbi:MAG: GNAT family N-acetyltransferase [Rhodospirillaceae bacterium]|jgi:ribosomal-protein-alanine N-acetyltransferase|nr:GNAT family N-acetyltransferase [Rhodospirillaceae bacterium]MBT3885089.1 GNAT family N-acetyltransferase [Rhodospirillaceae bacterium]MBT4116565.1 GNAT family N-acetyltransferase [Rhodospirillaceae bacterium]MBT4674625.1 GNAT family N-acetyltransferase [Rhodospirillaceae bacterium]MBT4721872.1 GNAT family N-acetyltransferase [Rhodospirillaceae bacterium]